MHKFIGVLIKKILLIKLKNPHLRAIKQFIMTYELIYSDHFSLTPYRQSALRLLSAGFYNPLDESNRMLPIKQTNPQSSNWMKTGARGKREIN